MMQVLRQFVLDERGQGLVEYALILALVAVAAITAMTFLGSQANRSLTNSAARITS